MVRKRIYRRCEKMKRESEVPEKREERQENQGQRA